MKASRPQCILPVPRDKKNGDRLFSRACSNRIRSNCFKTKEDLFALNIRRKFFYNEGGETLAMGCPETRWMHHSWELQGQAGWDSEQSWGANIPAHSRGSWTR